jgi:hypothetical protein
LRWVTVFVLVVEATIDDFGLAAAAALTGDG